MDIITGLENILPNVLFQTSIEKSRFSLSDFSNVIAVNTKEEMQSVVVQLSFIAVACIPDDIDKLKKGTVPESCQVIGCSLSTIRPMQRLAVNSFS